MAVWYNSGIHKSTGYEPNHIIAYFLIGLLISELTSIVSIQWDISMQIRNGDIDPIILLPLDFRFYWFNLSLGQKIAEIVGRIPLICILIFLILKLTNISIFNALIFLLLLPIIFILHFFISFVISTLSFWIQEVAGVYFFTVLLSNLLSGKYFPLDFLNWKLELISKMTPFYYLTYFPIKLILDPIENRILDIFILFLWCLIMYIFLKVLWRKGLKKYSSGGG